MKDAPIYQQIAESVRQDILYGNRGPGDRLPSVRDMAEQWGCTPGTVQRAYKELALQGLVVSRPGQGTHVVGTIPADDGTPLRRAALVHQAESFLLETLTAGYSASEVEQALRLALDRWRAIAVEGERPPERQVRFVGSHDPAVALIAARFPDLAPAYTLDVTFAGSLGGLIALAREDAELAGCHLWDAESDAYNAPFVRRLLPGRRVALLTLAHRRLGLITRPSNPSGVTGLADLTGDVRFINRQRGAGTRVWLDAQLRRQGIEPDRIAGYVVEAPTHSEVARVVAEEEADVGLGIEAAALSYGLGFVLLATERYDLAVPEEHWDIPAVQALADWLVTAEARSAIVELGGYEVAETGHVRWVG
jgi:molybdate-binding protein/DNA-binding transcriptional regulator YhcF (GntR family)